VFPSSALLPPLSSGTNVPNLDALITFFPLGRRFLMLWIALAGL
jgi:hypothetical protein